MPASARASPRSLFAPDVAYRDGPGGLARVDRVDLVVGREQGLNPWAPAGPGPGHHLLRFQLLPTVPGGQGVQLGNPLDSLQRPGGGEPAARSVLAPDIMVVSGPVVADEQHQLLQPLGELVRAALRKTPLAP